MLLLINNKLAIKANKQTYLHCRWLYFKPWSKKLTLFGKRALDNHKWIIYFGGDMMHK